MAKLNTGNSTTGVALIDQNNDLMTETPQASTRYGGATGVPNYIGDIRAFAENDQGAISGLTYLDTPYVCVQDQNLQVGLNTPLFDYYFNATAQDTNSWFYAFTTLTAIQAGGYLVFNSGNVGTGATGRLHAIEASVQPYEQRWIEIQHHSQL